MITYELDKNIYSKNVLLRTGFAFLSGYYVHLDSNDNYWIISLKCKENSQITNIDQLNGEFENALINEAFRESLLDKTKTVKEIIIARALFGADDYSAITSKLNFSSQQLDYSSLDSAIDNYIDDPLGIAIPWEEKYGKNSGKKDKQKS
jgi:His-Xaa-Ser system protein HxsD